MKRRLVFRNSTRIVGYRTVRNTGMISSFYTQSQRPERLESVRNEKTITRNSDSSLSYRFSQRPGRGLGLSIVGRKNEPGVYVSEVVKGGAAEADGRLMTGDQVGISSN